MSLVGAWYFPVLGFVMVVSVEVIVFVLYGLGFTGDMFELWIVSDDCDKYR